MMNERWMKVTLSPAQLSSGAVTQLQHLCLITFIQAGAPKDAAIFLRRNRHAMGTELYFSPAMVALVQSVIAPHHPTPTVRPPRSSSTVFIADGVDPFALLE